MNDLFGDPIGAQREDFEKLWQLAPGRGAKAKSWEQYKKAVPAKIDARTLHAARAFHIRQASAPKFVQHLERWIRHERWTDIEARPSSDENGIDYGAALKFLEGS